jgi:predicted PurR-regulated permease PerM
MWVPVALFELYLGNTGNAVFISLYTVIVISVIADTFIKPVIIDFVNKRLIGKQSKMNSLIIFFAIVAGLSTHGFWGMILGPAVTALFIAILSVYGSLRNSNI